MPNRESLYAKHPDYRVDLEPNPRRVQACLGDEVIADSSRTLLVRETRHDPVVYFPRKDVRFELLERTSHQSFCPFKGDASYWTVKVGDRCEDNIVWGYEDPFEQVSGLEGYVSFYPDRVELIEDA